MAETIRPFSCGSQYGDWTASNCERCTKDYDEAARDWRCDIQKAISGAYLDDGRISLEIADRMGYTKSHAAFKAGESAPPYVWPCKEWEPTEKWKAEYVAGKDGD